MLTVSFAFVVATALFLLFKQTRWMGVVGIFILLCISPLVFGGLLLGAGLIYYLLFGRRNSNPISKCPPTLTHDKTSRSTNAVLLLVALGLTAAVAIDHLPPMLDGVSSRLMTAVRSAPSDELIVLRTPGGLLEVSRIQVTELLDAQITHTFLGVEIGETVPRIRVPVVYRYHIELAPEWHLRKSKGVYTVVAPRIKPNLPVAIDLKRVERDVSGTWLLLPFLGRRDLQDLERGITAKLAAKAASRGYIEWQREHARVTVREFAKKWLVEQTRWRTVQDKDIRVLFDDEPVGPTAERLR